MERPLVLLVCTVALAAASCPTTDFVEDGCSLPHGLTVTSSPDKIYLDQTTCNSTYNKQAWQQQPRVAFQHASPDDKFAVLLVDPDAINTPKGSYFWHWLAANIPGSELKTGEWTHDYSLLKYRGPAPPAGTGLHRYQFILFRYEDPSKELRLELSDSHRRKFHLGDWLRSIQNQVQLCGPLAGLQFISQF